MAKRIVDEEMKFSIIVNGDDAQKELFDLEKSTRSLTRENKELRAEKARLKGQGKEESEQYKKLTQDIKENNAAIKANKDRTKELQNVMGVASLTLSQLSQRASELRLELRNMIPGSAEYNRLQAELQETNARMRELRLGAHATQNSLGSMIGNFNKYAVVAGSVIASAAGVFYTFQKLTDMNGQLSDSQADVMKTTGMTRKEVDELSASLGNFKTRTARIELLGLAEEAGRLGITGVKNLRDFVATANEIKVALGDDLSEDAIKEIGKITDIYKVGEQTGKEFAGSMTALGSAINEVSASGANQAGYLVDYLKRQAGIAAQARISADANLGYAATFDEIGQNVEVTATAMNKVWMDLFENTAVYADIAEMSLRDFKNLLEEDANEAMIRFLEGLNGNNEGLAVMVEKLSDLEVGGARGAQALSALSGSTEKLREKQRIANQALQEATSLTNEYEIKNNNLAATIDKVTNKIGEFFTSNGISGPLTALITSFGRLIGAIEDVDEAFAEETERSFEAAQANRRLADESSNLLREYEDLTKDGIKPTTEQKQRLEEITLQLKDRLGESVLMIDEETGAFKLNTEAVKEQIKIKRLAADEEAATLASRLKGTQEEIKNLQEKNKPIEREYEIRRKFFEKKNADDLKAIENNSYLSAMEKQQMKERLEGYSEMDKARVKLTSANDKIYQQEVRRKDLLERLNELNYSEGDIDLMFSAGTGEPKGPKEGETKIIGDQLYKFTGGKWTLMRTTYGGPGGVEESPFKVDPAKEEKELRRIQEENDRLKASLISESFKKEIAQAEANHEAKLQKLREQKIEEAEIQAIDLEIDKAKTSGDTERVNSLSRTKQIWLERNKALNDQMEYEEELHQLEIGKIIQKGLEEDFKKFQENFEREKLQRETAHNQELAALGNNREARKDLQEQYNREEQEIEARHLQELISRMNSIMQGGEFKGFDLELLSEDQKRALLDFLDQANLKLSDLLSKMSSAGEGEEGGGFSSGVDFLGFTTDQWDAVLGNLDSVAGKIEVAKMAIQSMSNAWGMYNNFVQQKQRAELEEFERHQDQKQERLKRQLDAGYINQRQYNRAVEELEKESRKKRAEMEYKQAKREKEMTIASIIMNTAAGVAQALAQGGFVLGVPWAAIVGAMGAAQLTMAMAAPLPAKGFEEGLYPVQREQDGKMFNASYGGETRSGLVDKPTLFLAGEGGKRRPEMIIDDRAWARFNPELKYSIHRELGRMGRVPGYEGGYYPEMRVVEEQSAGSRREDSSADYHLFIAALDRNSAVMERLEKQGVPAFLKRSMENARMLDEDIKDWRNWKSSNKIG